MSVLELLMIAFWSLCAAGILWCIVSVAGDVTYVTLADGRRKARSIPLIFKILLPLAPNFRHLVRKPLFKPAVARADSLLVQGGFEGLMSGEEFVALQLMLGWLPPIFWQKQFSPLPGVQKPMDEPSALIIIQNITCNLL
jgi:hypothetical protein